MEAKIIFPILTVMVLSACAASEDRELRDFLTRQDSHWTEIKCDVDTPGSGRPSGWQGGNKEGYYSGSLMGNGLLGTNMYKSESPDRIFHSEYRRQGYGREDGLVNL